MADERIPVGSRGNAKILEDLGEGVVADRTGLTGPAMELLEDIRTEGKRQTWLLAHILHELSNSFDPETDVDDIPTD